MNTEHHITPLSSDDLPIHPAPSTNGNGLAHHRVPIANATPNTAPASLVLWPAEEERKNAIGLADIWNMLMRRRKILGTTFLSVVGLTLPRLFGVLLPVLMPFFLAGELSAIVYLLVKGVRTDAAPAERAVAS